MRFPAISVSRTGGFFVVNEVDAYCNWRGYTNGFFDSLHYFDSDGKVWPVIDVDFITRPSVVRKIFGLPLKVKLQFGEPVADEMGRIKTDMIHCIKNDPDDLYCQFVSHKILIEKVRNSRSPAALIELVEQLGRH